VRRRAPVVVAALVLVSGLGVGVALVVRGGGDGGFRVDGNRILDPDGREFVVKGVVSPYGTFAGGDGGGLARRNEERATADFERMRALGVNTVKVYVTPDRMTGDAARARLDAVVRAARARELLVVLTGFWGRPQDTRPWLRAMARAYKDDPWVWLLPMNEPGCTGPEASPERCRDWEAWQRDHREYLATIREAGMTAPVIVNTPEWSWNVTGVEDHPLGDDQVVLGAHRYANDEPSFTAAERAEAAGAWARLARSRPVLLDEVGNYNGPDFANSLAWTQGMIDFATRWVRREEGAGVVAFNWRWSDPNTLTNDAGGLTAWGRTFRDGYLSRVTGHG